MVIGKLRVEIKRLRSIIRKKDMIIDTLTEKLLKLERSSRNTGDLYIPGGDLF